MAKLTISDAARACGVARTTIQRAVKTGRLSLDAEHQVDTAELLRLGYPVDAAVLHAASQQAIPPMQQDAAPSRSTPQRSDAALQELQLIRQERDLLQQERNRLAQQVDVLLALHQTTQQQLTQAQQMLQDMQHRYDRLLEAPRSAPAPAPGPGAAAASMASRGDMRRRIVALLQEHPDGLSPAQTRQLLGVDKDLGSTMKAMVRDGLLQRVETGRYVVSS
jgi:flagellar motor protein MotB